MESDNVFPANIVSCPKCNHTFENNRINGLAVIEAVNHIDARKRMYCKLALDSIEKLVRDGYMDHQTYTKIKKTVLDNFNDWGRDVQTILGLGNNVE